MMRVQRLLSYLLLLGPISCLLHAQSPKLLPYQDTNLRIDLRVDDLVSRMMLEEKTPEMVNTSDAIPRLDPRILSQVDEQGVRAMTAGSYSFSIGASQPGETDGGLMGDFTIQGRQELAH